MIEALLQAFTLIGSFDADLFEIIGLSLRVSLTAVLFAAVIGLPVGALIATRSFPGRHAVVVLVNTLMGLPPVVVGLLVYLWLSASGPLGVLQLLYTPAAMIIAQTILVTPILIALTRQIVADLDADLGEQLRIFGLTRAQQILTLLHEGRAALTTALLAGFGRAIAEVGAVLIVGGNINHVTRTMTTAIALETSKGELALAMALGFVLILTAGLVNSAAMALRSDAAPLPVPEGADMDQTLPQADRTHDIGTSQVMPIAGRDLVVRRDGRTLLDGVTITLGRAAGVTVVIGPNGAGKSLLIRALAGLVVPDHGQVLWVGDAPDRTRARRVGFVLQRPVMLRRTALDNLVYVLKLGGQDDATARAIARRHLAAHGLNHISATNAQRMSGGEQQRLALLRALILKPDVLFLDEPAANLDPASTLAIERNLHAAVEQGLRVVLVTQDLAQARRLADEIVFMHKGRIVETCEAAEFFRAPVSTEARAFLAGELIL